MEKKTKAKNKKPKEVIYGNNIRKLLEEKRMPLQELSDISGIPTPHLSRIMNGLRRCVSLPIAFKISTALNEPVEKVFIYKKPVVKIISQNIN